MIARDRKILAIRKAIDEFNLDPERPYDEYGGRKVFHYARQPILATDCDYEIVRISGVQGMKLPTDLHAEAMKSEERY